MTLLFFEVLTRVRPMESDSYEKDFASDLIGLQNCQRTEFTDTFILALKHVLLASPFRFSRREQH